jgi:cytochrome c-type biogenesis protein CcmH
MLARAYLRHARVDAPRASAWLERSEQSFRQAIALNPAAGEYATNLAAVSQQRALREPPAQRERAKPSVVDTFARALRLNPLDPGLWRLWGATQLGLLADPRGALASAQHALPLAPRDAAVYALVGESQVALARTQSGEAARESMVAAARAYEKAAELAPAQASYRVYSGQAYLAVGEASKAASAFRGALAKLAPTSRDRQATLGLLRRAEAAVNLTAAPPAR